MSEAASPASPPAPIALLLPEQVPVAAQEPAGAPCEDEEHQTPEQHRIERREYIVKEIYSVCC